jgi:hypothetical protein
MGLINMEVTAASVAYSVEEQFNNIMETVDDMTEDQAAQLLSSIISELVGMQKEKVKWVL